MKKTIFILSTFAFITTLILVACTGGPKGVASEQPISQDSLIKRGDYLVTTMGCDDCHSSKIMGPRGPEIDLEHRFGVHLSTLPLGKIDPNVLKEGWILFGMAQTATFGPWGLSYAANISSDDTGIGKWTEQQFFIALRKGKFKGMENSRPLLPPMPWQGFAKLNDTDIKAIFAYLKSTKPVNNLVPSFVALADIK